MFKKISKFRNNHYWSTLLLDSMLIIMVFIIISWIQNRGTLAADGQLAPDFKLQQLNGEFIELSSFKGRKVVVYFFAPWCHICQWSSGNLNDLRASRDESELQILIVGLEWQSIKELIDFSEKQNFSSPVLIGTTKQLEDYKIKGFPTYFIIDEEGKVIHRSVGYSTEIGLRLRT